MHDFLNGFIAGAKHTPRAYFAPLIAVWMLLVSTTDSLLRKDAVSEIARRGRN